MNVLYLSKDGGSPSVVAKMAGIRRYCQTRGWNARLVSRPAFTSAELAAILARHRPVGCVVDGVAAPIRLPPRLFRDIPVSYIGYKRNRTGNRPNFQFNTRAIAEAAFRELSGNKPPCYAAVGRWAPSPWSRNRVRSFRDVVCATGLECRVFPIRPRSVGEPEDGFVRRLAPWLSSLPEHCAVFAVSDQVAVRVEEAARMAARPIPRSLTLVSVDNFPEICERADPPISSIQLDFERIGWLAASALAARMEGRALREMTGRLGGEMKGHPVGEMKGRALREMEGRPAGEMKRNSFGGPAATLHCGSAAPSLRTQCTSSLPPQAAPPLRTQCAPSLPPQAAPSLPAGRAPSLQRTDGDMVVVGPLLVVRRKSTSGHGRHEPWIMKAVNVIRNEACLGLTVRDLAARFPGSRRLFEMRFREATGHSVLDEILHVRLEKAFTLLAQTDTAIGAVPALCGFRCNRTLDALFRSRCGMSMREWRRRNRG